MHGRLSGDRQRRGGARRSRQAQAPAPTRARRDASSWRLEVACGGQAMQGGAWLSAFQEETATASNAFGAKCIRRHAPGDSFPCRHRAAGGDRSANAARASDASFGGLAVAVASATGSQGFQTWRPFHRFVAHNFSSPGALVGWASAPKPHRVWPCAQAPGARPLPDVAATIASLVAAREAAESAPCLRGGRARHFRGELRRGLPRSAMARSRRRARRASRGRAMPRRAPRVGIIGRLARRVIQDM